MNTDYQDYQVTIVAQMGRKYPEKLRTYRWDERAQRWFADYSAYMKKHDIRAGNVTQTMVRKPFLSGHQNRNVIRIAKGCDVQWEVLSFICDAVRNTGRHTIEVEDVKAINSQHSSRILKLDSIPHAEERHAATEALRKLVASTVLKSAGQ